MSHEQKPGKLRLVNTQGVRRRTGDRREGGSSTVEPLPPASPTAAGRGPSLLFAGLFLFACAVGGGAGAWFRLSDLLRS